ncbi:MAG: hypothetical protein DDG59_05105 [Anaerolineae bacterium]|jgi:hypothetical protein|nr:MAG: hypothetical protein DDG59_05105 [Anaerolineae bacterium]
MTSDPIRLGLLALFVPLSKAFEALIRQNPPGKLISLVLMLMRIPLCIILEPKRASAFANQRDAQA